MIDIDWVSIGVGFITGVISSYLVCDLVFSIEDKNE